MLERLIGERVRDFTFRIVAAPTNSGDWYRVDAVHGHVVVTGASPIALVRGAYAYLEEIGAASVSWEGNRVVLPARLPDHVGTPVATAFAHRLFPNTCTFGYTTPYWT